MAAVSVKRSIASILTFVMKCHVRLRAPKDTDVGRIQRKAQPRSQVLSRSVGTGRREPWERAFLLLIRKCPPRNPRTSWLTFYRALLVVERFKPSSDVERSMYRT